jgi:hypothetical protein
LNPLSTTEQTNSSSDPSPVWPIAIWAVFITRNPLAAQAPLADMWAHHGRYTQSRETKGHFMVCNLFLHSFESNDDRPAARHTSREYSQLHGNSGKWTAIKLCLNEPLHCQPPQHLVCSFMYEGVYAFI